eukprot:4367947-Prymnesium_polylepis.1
MGVGGRRRRNRKRCGRGRRDAKERAVERARARAGRAERSTKWEENGGAVARPTRGAREPLDRPSAV